MRKQLLKAAWASVIVGVVFTLLSSFNFILNSKEMHLGFSLDTDTALRAFVWYVLAGFCASLLSLKFLSARHQET